MTTPDRFPGIRYDEAIKFINNTDATEEGEILYDGSSFVMHDSSGPFNPRSGSGGIDEQQHRDLDTLTHELDESSYDEITYTNRKISNITTWDSSSKNVKVREYQLTYSGRKLTKAVMIQYDPSGSIKEKITEEYSYYGRRIVSVTRTRNV